jgi:hypothetical protein
MLCNKAQQVVLLDLCTRKGKWYSATISFCEILAGAEPAENKHAICKDNKLF